jgi:hypothetical protein
VNLLDPAEKPSAQMRVSDLALPLIVWMLQGAPPIKCEGTPMTYKERAGR